MGTPDHLSQLRLVLDTNAVLSALLFRSSSLSWLRHAWQGQEIVPLASHDTTTELLRVLCYPKFGLTDDEREDLLADYLPWCKTIIVSDPLAMPACRDPLDLPFLELALAGHADALVTGDKDLLAMAAQFAIPIISPGAARTRLRKGWRPSRPRRERE